MLLSQTADTAQRNDIWDAYVRGWRGVKELVKLKLLPQKKKMLTIESNWEDSILFFYDLKEKKKKKEKSGFISYRLYPV